MPAKRKQKAGKSTANKAIKGPEIVVSNPCDSIQGSSSSLEASQTLPEASDGAGSAALTQEIGGFQLNSQSLESSRDSHVSLSESDISEQFINIMEDFSTKLEQLKFSEPISYIYNPLNYAKETHDCFIRKFCNSEKKVLFLGMNPGPFGMAQNGVPFGETNHVRDWLEITGNVKKPKKEHPKRPITGLDCKRSEVSGQRFWALWKTLCKEPDNFFKHGFVYNHCPLVFMSDTGKNITPPTVKVKEREPLNQLCDEMLMKLFNLLQVEVVVGIGKFAEERAKKVLKSSGNESIRVESILHPSPANPTANKGWDDIVKKQLSKIDVLKYFEF